MEKNNGENEGKHNGDDGIKIELNIPDIAYASIRKIGPLWWNHRPMHVNYETLSNNKKRHNQKREEHDKMNII